MPTSTLRRNRTALMRLKALAEETRLRLVGYLAERERCVCEIVEDLDLPQSLLSFHLKTLKDAGLVIDRRDGRWVYYTLNREALAEIEAFLGGMRAIEPTAPAVSARCRD